MGTAGPVGEFAKTLDDKGEGGAKVFLCKGEHCELPTADGDKVKELLLKP
ncbi:MAG: hypothetical protein GY953_29255 [bacterium]|nr:hypothetical protein [bacterium]